MNNNTNLTDTVCVPCTGDIPTLTTDEVEQHMAALHEEWQLDAEKQSIVRNFAVRGFAKAVYLANLAAYLADSEGHHPDIAFGWGYCAVSFTTHNSGGLTLNDFICAQKLDRLTITPVKPVSRS